MLGSLPDSVAVLLDAIESTGTDSLRFYLVKTDSGRYGAQGGYLVDEIGHARVYDSIGPARSLVTRIAKNSGESSAVVEFVAVPAMVFDEAARVAKGTEVHESRERWRRERQAAARAQWTGEDS